MSSVTANQFGLSHSEFIHLMEFSPIVKAIPDPSHIRPKGESLRDAAHATLMISIVILTLASIGIVISLIVYVIYYQKNRKLNEQLKRSNLSRVTDEDFTELDDEKKEPDAVPIEEPPEFQEKDFDAIRVDHVAISASYFNYRKRLQLNLKAINIEPIPSSYRDVIARNAYIYALIEVEHGGQQRPSINFESDLQNIDTENHFDETCEFDIALEQVHELQIRMSVFGCDRFSRNRLLCKLVFTGSKVPVEDDEEEKPVVQPVTLTESYRTYSSTKRAVTVEPQVMFSLCYMPTSGRLTVVALKAVCLCEDIKYIPSVSYLRITLSVDGRFVKTTQTQTTKKSLNPIYNEAFMFHVPLESLTNAEIQISVYLQQQSSKTPTLWGKIIVGPNALGEKAKKHWEMMLASAKKPVAQWHRVVKASGRQIPLKQPPKDMDLSSSRSSPDDSPTERGAMEIGVGEEIPVADTVSMEELLEEEDEEEGKEEGPLLHGSTETAFTELVD